MLLDLLEIRDQLVSPVGMVPKEILVPLVTRDLLERQDPVVVRVHPETKALLDQMEIPEELGLKVLKVTKAKPALKVTQERLVPKAPLDLKALKAL